MDRITRDRKRELLARFKDPTDLHLEASGIVAEVVPPPLSGWIAAGQVPEGIFNAATSAVQAGRSAVEKAVENLPEVFALSLRIVRASFKWPRPTEEGKPAADEDELEPETLPVPDLAKVLEWAMTGSPGSTVQTTSGEVKAEDLKTFRQDEALPGGGAGGGEVRPEAERDAGDS